MSKLIIILDTSDSMSRPFEVNSKSSYEGYLPDFKAKYKSKIDEAKYQLINKIKTSQFKSITIVPFSTNVLEVIEGELPFDSDFIIRKIQNIFANGKTNLAEALEQSIRIGNRHSKGYVRYLLITDGLSNTVRDDNYVIESMAEIHGMDGILIDFTHEGVNHLKGLCLRGTLTIIDSSEKLKESLNEIYRDSEDRSRVFEKTSMLSKKLDDWDVVIDQAISITKEKGDKQLGDLFSRLNLNNRGIKKSLSEVHNNISNRNKDANHYSKIIEDHINEIDQKGKIIESVKSYVKTPQTYRISLLKPKKFSKNYSSKVTISFYILEFRKKLVASITEYLKKGEENDFHTEIKRGTKLKVILKGTAIEVDKKDGAHLILDKGIVKTDFIVTPKNSYKEGQQFLNLIITESSENGLELFSETIEIKVVDLVFGIISRPILNNALTVFTSLAGIASYLLVQLGNFDKAFGLTAGTVGLLIAGFLFRDNGNNYKKLNSETL